MKITILVYPGLTPLDLVGPMQIWSAWPDLHMELVAESLDPMETDTVMRIVPTHTYETATTDPDIFFIPGGDEGTLKAMQNEALLDFVRQQGSRAKWVTSVCTGALILGAAGLLQGYKCTTHWLVLDGLKKFGAQPVKARWVIDRNRATGGGVTAGIDFGLALMAQLAGEEVAHATQLLVEYAPNPPFNSGTPDEAQPDICQAVRNKYTAFVSQINDMTGVLTGV